MLGWATLKPTVHVTCSVAPISTLRRSDAESDGCGGRGDKSRHIIRVGSSIRPTTYGVLMAKLQASKGTHGEAIY